MSETTTLRMRVLRLEVQTKARAAINFAGQSVYLFFMIEYIPQKLITALKKWQLERARILWNRAKLDAFATLNLN